MPNVELSKIIAEGKAIKEKSCIGKLYSTEKGFINGTVVQALLDQELAFFKQNPGIKGKYAQNVTAITEFHAKVCGKTHCRGNTEIGNGTHGRFTRSESKNTIGKNRGRNRGHESWVV